MCIYVGCSGWSYKEWRGVFYPEALSPREYLAYYSRYFNTVEVNSTFYHLPTKKTVTSWYTQTSPNFKYSLKASRVLTHLKKFKDVEEPLAYFYGLGDLLAEKMGCFLFQFPGTFTFTPENLERIVAQLDENYRNVVEFRHPSWWNTTVCQAFASANITFCTVSGFPVPEDLILTHNAAYIRFHGDPTYAASYADSTLSRWHDKIREDSLDAAWIYFNNTYLGAAIKNASYMKDLLPFKDPQN